MFTLTEVNIATNMIYRVTEAGNIMAVGTIEAASNVVVQTWGGAGADFADTVIQSSDGGFAIAGTTASYGAGGDDAFIAKYDKDGGLSWSRSWGGTADDSASSIIQTTDEGFVIVGRTASFGAGSNSNAFIAKYSADGTFLWNKTWGGAIFDYIDSIIQTSDGGFAVAGTTTIYGAGSNDAFIAKYTSEGVLLWNKTWGGTAYDDAYSIIQTSDHGYLMAGATASFGSGNSDAFIAKFTNLGVLSWSRTWGGTSWDDAYSVIQTSDDNYVISGVTNNYGAGGYDAFMVGFTSAGVLSWDKTWGGWSTDEAYSMIKTSDGGFAMAGITDGKNVFIAKFESDGSLQWDKTLRGTVTDYAKSITQTTNGDYIVVGITSSYGAGDSDALISKYSSNGVIDGCPSSICDDSASTSSIPSLDLVNQSATVTSPSATITSPSNATLELNPITKIVVPVAPTPPAAPIPTPTIVFSAQEMYIAYPGESQTVCKEWTAPEGKAIKGFYVSQETETNYDFFDVSLDGVKQYHKSGSINDEYVDMSSSPGSVLSACVSADESVQNGYGGEVTGVYYE